MRIVLDVVLVHNPFQGNVGSDFVKVLLISVTTCLSSSIELIFGVLLIGFIYTS